jgi:Na+/H+-dicarboxylate symporter
LLPIGATINMDAGALYQIVATIFISQINGMQLSFSDIFISVLTAIFASIGGASIPGGVMTSLVMVLDALNLPTNQISMVFAADWIM